jgi:hypothetical protein
LELAAGHGVTGERVVLVNDIDCGDRIRSRTEGTAANEESAGAQRATKAITQKTKRGNQYTVACEFDCQRNESSQKEKKKTRIKSKSFEMCVRLR